MLSSQGWHAGAGGAGVARCRLEGPCTAPTAHTHTLQGRPLPSCGNTCQQCALSSEPAARVSGDGSEATTGQSPRSTVHSALCRTRGCRLPSSAAPPPALRVTDQASQLETTMALVHFQREAPWESRLHAAQSGAQQATPQASENPSPPAAPLKQHWPRALFCTSGELSVPAWAVFTLCSTCLFPLLPPNGERAP